MSYQKRKPGLVEVQEGGIRAINGVHILFQWSIYPNLTVVAQDNNIEVDILQTRVDEYIQKLRVRLGEILRHYTDKPINIYAVRGPGGYTGIRQTMSFLMGILAGSLSYGYRKQGVKIYVLDSFGFIEAIVALECSRYFKPGSDSSGLVRERRLGVGLVFLQALPRLELLAGSSSKGAVKVSDFIRNSQRVPPKVMGYLKLKGRIEYTALAGVLKRSVKAGMGESPAKGLFYVDKLLLEVLLDDLGIDTSSFVDLSEGGNSEPHKAPGRLLVITPEDLVSTLKAYGNSQWFGLFGLFSILARKIKLSSTSDKLGRSVISKLSPLYVNEVNITHSK